LRSASSVWAVVDDDRDVVGGLRHNLEPTGTPLSSSTPRSIASIGRSRESAVALAARML
jgi:hypothetical protein